MSKNALVTGSAGLVGSAVTRLLLSQGWHVAGIDNNTRGRLFGDVASTWDVITALEGEPGYEHSDADICDSVDMEETVREVKPDFIVHAAGQPSHEWSALHPEEDFEINALGTLNVLEAARRLAPTAPFAFLGTNKVYGDLNWLAYTEHPTRYHSRTIHEGVSVDQSTHSPFGVSKLSADLMVQEYGRYFNLPTVSFRCGCITGASHKAVEAHGFLAYLVKCAVTGQPYTVYGYGGKQVRDQIHASDLARLLLQFYEKPSKPGEVFNVGGGQENSISIQEATQWLDDHGYPLDFKISRIPRKGDHRAYITDLTKVRSEWPSWTLEYNLDRIMEELVTSCSTSQASISAK